MAAGTQAPRPPAPAENGLISREIMQVNAVKSNTRIHALLASPTYNDISILIVSDPWWGPIGTAKHDTDDQHRLLGAPVNPLWRCFAPPIDTQNPASPPSCVVYVRKDRGIMAEIDPLSPATPFFFIMDIFINGFEFKIVPVYLHGPKHAEVAEALFQLPMIETPTLVCGDFNIQHPDFVDFPGAKVKSSTLGREFAGWLLDSDLHMLNDLHRPTREPRVQGHAPSIIDFTIANGALFSMDIISDWDSSFAHSLDSDHAAIFFTIHAPRVSERPANHFHFVIDPLMEDDWIAVFEHRALELGLKSTITCPQEVEELASGLLSACTWATEAVMESRPTQHKAPRAPWWNEDCSAACGRVVTAKEEGMDSTKSIKSSEISGEGTFLRSAQRSPEKGLSLENFPDFLTDRDEIRAQTSHLWYCIRKAKRTFFDEICSTARPDNIWSINQWYRGWKSYGLPTLRGPDGTLATTNLAKAELLHDTFFPYTLITPTGQSVEAMTQNTELPFPTISKGEIAANLASCSNKSAPGAHGSNYRVLRWAFAARGDLIEVLYNAMLSFEYHPVCLKNALIAPIPKPNKFDFASPKAYRPISLLETLSKLFEKIMAARFTALSGLHSLIPPEQFGGKDMTSCMDAGLSLIHDIEGAWAAKKQASITLLDISGYFNNIDHDLLVRCMQKMGYPAQVLGWLRSYLSNRTASFRINDEVGMAFGLQGRGIPQGSPLSPVFSSIFTAPMLMSLRARGVRMRAYIDDLCIFQQSGSQEGCIAGLLEGTCATLEALSDMGLSAERSKTERREYGQVAGVLLGPAPELQKSCVEDGHEGQVCLGRDENVGEQPSGLVGIPRAHARSSLNSKGHCKTLQTVQNIACRWASGSFRTAPTAVLEHTIAMPPISFRLRHQCTNYSAKLRHLPSSSEVCARLPHSFRTSVPKLATTARSSPINALAAYTSPNAEARVPYLLMPWEGVKLLDDRLAVSMPSCRGDAQKKAYALALQSRITDLAGKTGVATLYTDGSCYSQDGTRHTGWGWCLQLGSEEIDHAGGALGPNHTSYDAECCALAEGVARVARLAHQTPLYLLHIVSDNAGMLQGLLSSKPKGAPSSLDRAARDICDLASQHAQMDLLLSWCPAHHQVPGNERADAIAKAHTTTTPTPAFSVSTDRIRWEAKERLLAEWEVHWNTFKEKHPNSMGALALMNPPHLRLHPFHAAPGKHWKLHTQLRSP
ncbi:Reverse transcriptase from mobile element jockey protein [Ceratobasidium theobromae]|uniref:Reverse transcriptase from mobile element jockey protein n=1 Tax=Ceratobasidium theobromae TaxID=1582974 RepID=A0A5N5Q806_9AGAM|nr:Reverse transcriptase from mobile element jockey protein [Ceratobasidium theobromae]